MGSVVAIIFALPLIPIYLPRILKGAIEIGTDLPSILSTAINIFLEEFSIEQWLINIENLLPEFIEEVTAALSK